MHKVITASSTRSGFLASWDRLHLILFLFLIVFTGYILAGSRSHESLGFSSTPSSSILGASPTYRYDEAIFSMYSGPGFLPALAVLAYNLDQHSPTRKRFLYTPWNMTMSPEEESTLDALGWHVKRVPVLDLPGIPGTARYATGLIKLNAWNETQYDRIATIDADIMIVGSLDYAFDMLRQSDTMLAVAPDTVKKKSASSDSVRGRFNAGVMFVKPSTQDYDALATLSSNATYYDVNYADQSLLNNYFLGDYLGLDMSWNLLAGMVFMPEYWKKYRPKARAIHFAGGRKPWRDTDINGKAIVLPSRDDLALDDIFTWRSTFRKVAQLHNLTSESFMNGQTPDQVGYNATELLQ